MLKIDIKNFGTYEIENLVLDMNGTIACDGELISGIAEHIEKLLPILKIFLISADTFGTSKKIAEILKIQLITIQPNQSESEQKEKFVNSLGNQKTIAIGNGRNDVKMLKKACIGIGIIGSEGMATEILRNAKIIVKSPLDALELLLSPKRLLATLRE